MNKIEFKDLPDTSTPYNAETFNLLQDNVEDDLGLLSDLNTSNKTNLVSSINESLKYNSYSSDEINTGQKWLDGKTIYKKIIYVSNIDCTSEGFKTVNHNIQNFDRLVDARYMFGNNTIYYQTFNSVITTLSVNSSNIRIYINTNWDPISDWYFVLYYTKNEEGD